MATNKETINALKRIAKKLEALGVKSEDLKILKMHIGQQSRQISWEFKNGKWVQHKTWKYGKHKR
jgi:hypothetical protein